MLEFISVKSDKDLIIVRDLFKEYASSLGFDLCFQNFDKEIAELPGEYVPPDGRLIIAKYKSEIVGCVALKKLSNSVCEMKRLYIKPEYRGKGIGRALVNFIINEAHEIGYTFMRLDTVPAMNQAISLYRSIGFYEIEPYRYNPIPGAMYLELNLKKYFSDTGH